MLNLVSGQTFFAKLIFFQASAKFYFLFPFFLHKKKAKTISDFGPLPTVCY